MMVKTVEPIMLEHARKITRSRDPSGRHRLPGGKWRQLLKRYNVLKAGTHTTLRVRVMISKLLDGAFLNSGSVVSGSTL